MCGIGNVHAGLIHLHLQHMKIKAGLHLLFTREVLAEIPAVTLAITSPWVTSFSIKGVSGVRDGRCGWYGNVMGGERERGRDNVQRVVTGYNRLMSHEHFLEDLLWSFSRECLNIRLSYTHTHTQALFHTWRKSLSVSCIIIIFFVSLKAVTEARLLLKGVHVQASMKSGVRVRVHVCAFLLQSESPSQQ